MKKTNVYFSLALISSLALLPGCMSKKKKQEQTQTKQTHAHIPLADHSPRPHSLKTMRQLVLEDDDSEGGPVFKLRPVQHPSLTVAQNAQFEPIYFEFDKYTIRDDQKPTLEYNSNLALEAQKEGKSLVVEGHADKKYINKAYNIAVSQKRAHTVADSLKKVGVMANAIGYGDDRPAVNTPGKEEKNRRAEIVTLGA